MRETELNQKLLDLEAPGFVSEVKIDSESQKVDVSVDHLRGTQFPSPECGNASAVYDHTPLRSWRHLDTMQFRTYLHADTPRVSCDEHGVQQVKLPWALKSSRFTLLFERFSIDVLLATQTVQGAQGILRITWDETWGILERAVERGRARKSQRPLPRIGIDEKAFRKGQNYITLLYDLDHGTVEAISDGNDVESGNACFSQLSCDQLDSVEAIAMDMSAAFVKSAKQNLAMAETKIVMIAFT